MVTITSKATSKQWQSAMLRAKANYDGGLRAIRVADRTYIVPSASDLDVAYVVEIRNVTTLDISCSCPSGQHPERGYHCWHQALAASMAVERVSRKRPAPQPAPTSISKPAPRPQLPPAAVTEAENAAAVARLFPRAA